MDLLNLESTTLANAGIDVVIRHPVSGAELVDAKGQQVVVTVLGEQSDAYQKLSRSIMNRHLATQSKKRKGQSITIEELEAEELQVLAVCVKGWKNVIVDKEVVEFSPDNVRRVFSDRRLAFLKTQVMDAIRDETNFIKS